MIKGPKKELNCLIISSIPLFRGIMKFTLETHFNVNVTELDSEEKGLTFLRGAVAPSAIIYDYNPDAYLLEDFVVLLSERSKRVPIIILMDKVRDEGKELLKSIEQIKLLEEKEVPQNLLVELKGVFFGEALENNEPYCRISINFLTILDGINKNLFIKLGEGKYVQLFREDDSTEVLDIDRFSKKGLEYLYLTRETAEWVIGQMQRQISIFLKSQNFRFILRGANETPEKKFERQIIRFDEDIHMDEEFKAQVMAAIQKVRKIVEKEVKLRHVFESLKANQENERAFSQRVKLLSLISCQMAKKLEWDSRITIDKLVFASTLCDITLAVKASLMGTLGEDGLENISAEDKKIYMDHPKECSIIVKNSFTAAPPDTDVLILQHHERPNGSGFPGGVSGDRISSLSALFIIANDFVDYLFQETNPDVEDYLLKAENRFDHVNFRRPLRAVKTLK